jgi:thiol-disulfide isomerase/thioredoxin
MRWPLGGIAALALAAVALLKEGRAADGTGRPGPIGRGADEHARSLIGTTPPPLPALPWLDGKARTLRSLAGQVVLVRNFTDGCPFCASTLPALEQIHRDLRGRGLVVLGVYHPKPPRPVTTAEAERHARALGVSFPVGVDPDWALVKSWWLGRSSNEWTSVTWVLDKKGVIRYVHPGGEYHAGGGADHARCRADEQQLRATLARLLAE